MSQEVSGGCLCRAGCGMRRLLQDASQENVHSGAVCTRIYVLRAGLPAEVQACFHLARAGGERSSKVPAKLLDVHLAFPERLLCVTPVPIALPAPSPLSFITTSEFGILIPVLPLGEGASSRVWLVKHYQLMSLHSRATGQLSSARSTHINTSILPTTL